MPKNKYKSVIIKYLTAVAFGLIIFLLINVVFSFIIVNSPYPKDNSLLYALVSIALSSFISSFFYCFKQKQNGLVSGLIIGAALTILFFIIYSIISSFNLSENSVLIIPSSIFPAAVAGIFAVNLKHKK